MGKIKKSECEKWLRTANNNLNDTSTSAQSKMWLTLRLLGESLFQLTWSVVSFGGFQFLVIFLHLVFTVMFRDLVATNWQITMIPVLIANFSATVIYLAVLFLYGKKIHHFKYGQSIRNSIGNNLPFQASTLTASAVKKQNQTNSNADINLLANHPPVSRTNSVCKSTSTTDDLDAMEAQPQPTASPPHEHSPPPSNQSSPEV